MLASRGALVELPCMPEGGSVYMEDCSTSTGTQVSRLSLENSSASSHTGLRLRLLSKHGNCPRDNAVRQDDAIEPGTYD